MGVGVMVGVEVDVAVPAGPAGAEGLFLPGQPDKARAKTKMKDKTIP
jgi:hypothetical protein